MDLSHPKPRGRRFSEDSATRAISGIRGMARVTGSVPPGRGSAAIGNTLARIRPACGRLPPRVTGRRRSPATSTRRIKTPRRTAFASFCGTTTRSFGRRRSTARTARDSSTTSGARSEERRPAAVHRRQTEGNLVRYDALGSGDSLRRRRAPTRRRPIFLRRTRERRTGRINVCRTTPIGGQPAEADFLWRRTSSRERRRWKRTRPRRSPRKTVCRRSF